MRKERTRSKHGFNDFGGFLLGWILGFIFTICLMIIIGFWAYTSVNIKKIEKWGKIEITDNDGLENLTMEKMVSIIRSFNNTGYKDYTLGQLEEDFNIKLLDNSIYGIDLTRLKTAPLGELRDALDDTLDTITFTNVLRLMETDSENMGVFDTVLNNTLTYYLKDGKLYKNYSNN